MRDMRDASTLNFKTPLPHHALSQDKITNKFMTRWMLSDEARAGAKNKSR